MDLNGANSVSFGSLGFGGAKTGPSEPSKPIFGGSVFGSTTANQAQQQKSPFGSSSSGILKNPTFTMGQSTIAQPATSVFGGGGGGGGTNTGLFSTATSTTQAAAAPQEGSLFSSFKTPQKGFGTTAQFGSGPAPAFSAAPTFGSGATFGSPPAFGASATPMAGSAFGGGSLFGSASTAPTFDSLASKAQPQFGSSMSGGSVFGSTFGQNANASNQMGFASLAQQQPQTNLFSSFTGYFNFDSFLINSIFFKNPLNNQARHNSNSHNLDSIQIHPSMF